MHVRTIGDAYGMTPADRELQFASIAFDGAHERTWVPLAFGAALMPRDDTLWSVERTAEEIARHGITIACFTPTYLRQMAETLGEAARGLPIRSYTVGGEAMPRASFDLVQAVLQPPRLINGYGPTETVITPMIAVAGPSTRFDSAAMPIGRLVGDRTAHVLDADLNRVPPGGVGELYLGGSGIARGYLGRPDLTCVRFVADPFGADGARLYRTGDRVRWRADGELEYLGRTDHQVKVRGFRIEPGEIEARLLALPGVREAVVVARDGAWLAAYVSPRPGAELDAADLKVALRETLPEHMVPGAIVLLDQLPLNANGKVDRGALPDPGDVSGRVHEPPEAGTETELAGIWAAVLGAHRIGRQDNFFELGGHSLALLQVQSKVQQTLAVQLPLGAYFENATLAALAEVVRVAQSGSGEADDLARMTALLDSLEN
jgi:acyl-coenzyme A synthetase/AMP-(fatty) acid ligase